MISNYTSFIIDLSKTNRALLTTEKKIIYLPSSNILQHCVTEVFGTQLHLHNHYFYFILTKKICLITQTIPVAVSQYYTGS